MRLLGLTVGPKVKNHS